jgi:hypothetical protein
MALPAAGARARPWLPALFGVLAVYLLAYAWARVTVFHAVERYAGAEGKGGPRRDFIAKRDLPAGQGWEYTLFLPAIRVEEAVTSMLHANGLRR